MKAPEFKRRKTFAGDVKAPCLRAVLANSVVPGLAAKHQKGIDRVRIRERPVAEPQRRRLHASDEV